MLMNYHELTIDEPRDSPARRKQFLVICTVIASVLGYTALTSGAFQSLDIQAGEFPGGEFIYKFTKRDYAASFGLKRSIAKDLGIKNEEYVDILYSVYLDDPNKMGGRRQRFAAGLLQTGEEDAEMRRKHKELITSINETIVKPTEEEILELAADDLWTRLHYTSLNLPKVKAAVVQFPFTNGFVSALILSHKVIPKLRKFAQQNMKDGSAVVVISTCSVEQSMCTHYTPLEKGDLFLLGEKETDTYAQDLGPEDLIDFKKLKRIAKHAIPFADQLASDKATGEVLEKASVKMSEKTTEEVTEQAKEPVTEQETEQVTDDTVQKAEANAKEQPTEQTTEEAAEQVPVQATQQVTDEAVEQSTEVVEQVIEQAEEPTSEQVPETATNSATEQETEPLNQEAAEQETEHEKEHTPEQPTASEQVPEPATNSETEQVNEQVNQEASEQGTEHEKEHTPEQPTEQVEDQAADSIKEEL